MMLSDMKVAVTKRTSVPEEVIPQKKKHQKPKVKRTLRPFMTLKAQRIKC